MYKKITFLTLLFLLSISNLFCMRLPFLSQATRETDPVKLLITGALNVASRGFTSAAYALQQYSPELTIASALGLTAVATGALALNWYQTYQECDRLHNELLYMTIKDFTFADGDSQTFRLYQTFPDYARNARLGILVAEFNTFFKTKNKEKLLKTRNEISLFVADEKSLFF